MKWFCVQFVVAGETMTHTCAAEDESGAIATARIALGIKPDDPVRATVEPTTEPAMEAATEAVAPAKGKKSK